MMLWSSKLEKQGQVNSECIVLQILYDVPGHGEFLCLQPTGIVSVNLYRDYRDGPPVSFNHKSGPPGVAIERSRRIDSTVKSRLYMT